MQPARSQCRRQRGLSVAVAARVGGGCRRVHRRWLRSRGRHRPLLPLLGRERSRGWLRSSHEGRRRRPDPRAFSRFQAEGRWVWLGTAKPSARRTAASDLEANLARVRFPPPPLFRTLLSALLSFVRNSLISWLTRCRASTIRRS